MAQSTIPAAARSVRQDRLAQVTLGLAIILNMILFALVILAHEQLEPTGANAATSPGTPTQFVAPPNAIMLPVIGLAAWLLGGALGLYYYIVRSEPPIAYTIWGAILLVQLTTWVTALALLFDS